MKEQQEAEKPTSFSHLSSPTFSPIKTLSSEFTPLAVSTRLPAECLQLIIAHYDGDLTMLHSLLLVNTTCFHLAVRLLYRSPFKLLRSYDGDKLPWNKYVRQVKLVWLLLSCVLHNQWVMDELPPIDQSFPVLRNPMRHGGSTTVDVAERDGRKKDGIDLTTTTTNTIRDLTVDYLRLYTHHDHATLSDAFPELFPGVACSLMDEWAQSKDRAQLRQTIERAFLLHQPENIISLSIPISRMKIYLEAVPRLPKLECVEFYDIRNWDTGNVEEAITFVREHDRFAIQSQQRFQKDVGNFGQSSAAAAAAAAATADTATATSRNVHADPEKMAKLIEIKLGGSGDSGIIQTTELYKILQAMRHPKVVDLTEWKGAVMDIMQIPVKTLQILRMRLDRPLPITCPLGSFLLQARSLRELQISIAPTHGRLFRWAVKKMQQRNKQQTKVAKQGIEGNHGGTQQQQQTIRHPSDNQQGKSQYSTSNVMEEGLQVLSLAGETATVVQALNAAVWGFNNTLEILQANTWKENSGLQFEDVVGVVPQADEAVVLDMDDEDDNNIQSGENTDESNSDDSTGNENAVAGPLSSSLCFSFNHKTPMTRLHTLELKGEVSTLSFDFQSLRYCPHLNTLRLNTRPCRVEPDTDAVDKILANTSGSLTELELIGLWWITDHHLNQVVKCLPKLRRLRIGHAPSLYTITPLSTRVVSFQSSESISCAGFVHAVEQLRELRELWLGVDKDSYRRRQERNSNPGIFSFFSKRNSMGGNEKEQDVWTTLADTIRSQSEHRVIPLTVEIQHCPT